MCGRTGQAIPPGVIERRWGVNVPADYEPRYNVAPREPLAVVPSESETVAMSEWGLLPEWIDDPDDWHYPINARAETVAERATFREAFADGACLVLSSGYYEWRGDRGSAQPYRICRQDREPFAMAGIRASRPDDGADHESVAVLTREATGVVEPIHDRMPVVLSRAEEEQWLTGSLDRRRELLESPDDVVDDAYPISTAINDPTAEGADLIEPLDHEQGGLGAFGV